MARLLGDRAASAAEDGKEVEQVVALHVELFSDLHSCVACTADEEQVGAEAVAETTVLVVGCGSLVAQITGRAEASRDAWIIYFIDEMLSSKSWRVYVGG